MTNPAPLPGSLPPLVLLVEDDVDTRDMYHTALEYDGCLVVEAPNSADALTSAVELQPDIIVTDIGLPGVRDGLGLARGLRQNPMTADIPVLAVTGRDPGSFGDDAGLFDAVFLKPVLPDELVARIRETITHSRQLHQRSALARQRVAELLSRAERVLNKSQLVFERRAASVFGQPCPRCGDMLLWTERRTLSGVTFDYFHPCQKGCGLFCYNHGDRAMVSLAGG
jgi:DNA-binding response OmpR family regulator